jgi:type IV pilus assembly protein PilQ
MKRFWRWTKVAVWTAGLVLAVQETTLSAESEGTISLKHENSLYTMEFRNAEIKDVLRALGQENHLNIIISNDIEGKLTLSFQGVSFQEALDSILRMNSLTSFRDGNIIRVMKSPFSDGEESLVTQMVPVNFASAKEVQDTVKVFLSKKGSIMADVRTNTLVVRDVQSNLERVVQVIRRLDSKTPEVMIEARIVEVNTNYSRELGVQWGGIFSSTSGNRTVTLHGGGFKSSSSDTVSQSLTGGIGVSGGPFAVNLPANVGPGLGGALGLSIGNVLNTRLLDIQLSALEDTGNGKILSNPRILTLNNKEAKISSGTEILIPTTSIVATSISPNTSTASGLSGNTGVTTIDAKLELAVTPHVTPDQQILMHIRTDKKDPDYNRQVQNIPPLTTRTAETDLLVKDKETIVIGGIYTRNESTDEAGVPWLSKIPVLGWLFKKQTKIDNQNELMIFITPTIYHGNEEEQ